MFELTIETDFSAAHNLREYKGQCERLHGHNWKLLVILKAEKLDKLGMVMDFRDAKSIIGEIISRFDHVYLNELINCRSVLYPEYCQSVEDKRPYTTAAIESPVPSLQLQDICLKSAKVSCAS